MTYRSEILTRIELNGTQIFADIRRPARLAWRAGNYSISSLYLCALGALKIFKVCVYPPEADQSVSKKEIPIQLS
jgi:hypothetical protein